jgi:thioredoxin reductase (NADPH)
VPDAYDVAVIGGGAAGLSAALVLARARRRVAVFDDGKPRNAGVPHAYGFLGHDGIAGSDLLARGRDELGAYGCAVTNARATALAVDGDAFRVTAGERTIAARAVVLATGFIDVLPPIEGLASIWGTDAADCPYCHGWEVRDGALAVVGTPKRLPRTASILTIWSHDVMLFSADAPSFDASQRARLDATGVRVVARDVRAVETENGRLRAVVLSDGERIARSAIFVNTKRAPGSDLVRGLCDTDDGGFVATDADGATSRPGIWAVGNVTDRIAKLVHSAAAGSRTATRVNEWLFERDLLARARP